MRNRTRLQSVRRPPIQDSIRTESAETNVYSAQLITNYLTQARSQLLYLLRQVQ